MPRRPSRERWELGYPGGRGREQEAGYPRYSDELADPRRPHRRGGEDASRDHYQDATGYDPQAQPNSPQGQPKNRGKRQPKPKRAR
jgi:hypothetical protein